MTSQPNNSHAGANKHKGCLKGASQGLVGGLVPKYEHSITRHKLELSSAFRIARPYKGRPRTPPAKKTLDIVLMMEILYDLKSGSIVYVGSCSNLAAELATRIILNPNSPSPQIESLQPKP